MNKKQCIDFFKRESKRVLKECREAYIDEPITLHAKMLAVYSDNPTLLDSQEVIAQSVDFGSWKELLKASDEQLSDAVEMYEFEAETCGDDLECDEYDHELGEAIYSMMNGVKLLKDLSPEKQQQITKDQDIKFSAQTMVKCSECGRCFPFEESNVIIMKGKIGGLIVCKYFFDDDCPGTLLDMVSVAKGEERGNV